MGISQQIGASSLGKPGVCTSTTRPATPYEGQMIYETDTDKVLVYNGTAWVYSVIASPTFTGTVTTPALTVTNATTSGSYLQGTDYLSPYQGFRNLIINGAMNIWQRATDTGPLGLYGGGYYSVDRWWLYNNGYTSRMTQQLVGSTLPTFLYCMRFQRTSGETSVTPTVIHTPQETINSVRLAGKQATLSFYARASSGMSNTSGVSVMVNTGTGTDQKNLGASTYTGGATPITTTPTLTTSWQRFTVTGTIASTTTEIDIQINYVPAGTAGASDYFEITGVQLEEGSVATPFEHRPYSVELDLCQRYFQQEFGIIAPATTGGFNNSYAQTYFYKKDMRVSPTVRVFSATNYAGTEGSLTGYPPGTTTSAYLDFQNSTAHSLIKAGVSTYNLIVYSFKADAEL